MGIEGAVICLGEVGPEITPLSPRDGTRSGEFCLAMILGFEDRAFPLPCRSACESEETRLAIEPDRSGITSALSGAGFAILSVARLDRLDDILLLRGSIAILVFEVQRFAGVRALWMRSIEPRTVVPFIAKFSSAIDSKRTTPRSGGTLRISEMKD